MPPNAAPRIALSVLALAAAGCRQDMHDQPKYRAYAATDFFGDGRSARPQVADTVARGHLKLDAVRDTGKKDGVDVAEFPFAVTLNDIRLGQERFTIYCSPCHGRVGDGRGLVALRGFRKQPASYHTDRLRQAPAGHFIDVISNGFGAMPSYASRIPPDDRWRIVAYIRALQLSQNAQLKDVPSEHRNDLEDPR